MIRLRAGLVRCGVVALALFLGACSDDDEAPPVPPTATATQVPAATATRTVVPATSTQTPVPATATETAVPSSTATPVPPTSTATAIPPTSTATAIPPTSTATAVPPTETPTNTPVPPTATATTTPTATTAITNVRALHTKGSAQYDADCLKCHADVVTEQSLDPQIPGAHAAMLPTFGGAANAACTVCHKAVDFEGQSAANVRRNVDVRGCVNCHSAGGLKYYQPTN